MHTVLQHYPRACQRVAANDYASESDWVSDSCRVIQDLGLLLEISQTMESSLEVRDIIRPALRKMAASMGMTRGAVTIRHRTSGEIF
ncbi:MAG: hypothetical protein ACYC23_21170, partial [Limisphaerales bacterium]